MGKNRYRNQSKPGSTQRPSNNNNHNNNKSTTVDLTLKACKPQTKGAEHIIFSAAGGAGSNDAHQFTEKRLKLAEVIPQVYTKGGAVIAKALEDLKEPTFEDPANLPDDATDAQKKRREVYLDNLYKNEGYYLNNNQNLYYLLKTHCTDTFMGQLKTHDEFEDIQKEMNGVKLAQLMEKTYLSDGQKKGTKSKLQLAAKTEVALFRTVQGRDESNEHFVESLKARKDLAESFGKSMGRFEEKMREIVKEKANAANIQLDTTDDGERAKLNNFTTAAKKAVQEEYFVFVALELADRSRFHGMTKQMETNELTGEAKWPKTYADLIALLNEWEIVHPRKTPQQQQQQQQQGAVEDDKNDPSPNTKVEDSGKANVEGPSFMQLKANEEADAKSGVKTNRAGESACHMCGAEDHWKDQCPKNPKNQEGFGGMQQQEGGEGSDSDGELWIDEGVNFVQADEEENTQAENEDVVYFDSCTVKTTIARKHLTGITDDGQRCNMLCNAGTMTLTEKGFLGDLPSWARESGQGIANLISIPEVESFLKLHGGHLEYSSNGDWKLTLGGRTVVLPRAAHGSCKGMPYLPVEIAREISYLWRSQGRSSP